MDQTIVSLSTIPPRFGELLPTLNSLREQSLPVDEIRVYIPHSYKRFPRWDGALPKLPDWVCIHRTDVDLGPATKVLPACRDLRGQNVDILFCDDDKTYDREWHSRFKKLRQAKPDVCLVEAGEAFPDMADEDRSAERLPRGERRVKDWKYRLLRASTLTLHKPFVYKTSGYVEQISGYAGVMVRPEWFDDEAWDIPDVMWTVDDPWLSGHLERAGVPIWLSTSGARLKSRAVGGRFALLNHVEDGLDRVEADLAVIDYFREKYGIWPVSSKRVEPKWTMTESMWALARRTG